MSSTMPVISESSSHEISKEIASEVSHRPYMKYKFFLMCQGKRPEFMFTAKIYMAIEKGDFITYNRESYYVSKLEHNLVTSAYQQDQVIQTHISVFIAKRTRHSDEIESRSFIPYNNNDSYQSQQSKKQPPFHVRQPLYGTRENLSKRYPDRFPCGNR